MPLSRFFHVTNMSINAIRENKSLTKISLFTAYRVGSVPFRFCIIVSYCFSHDILYESKSGIQYKSFPCHFICRMQIMQHL